MKFIILAIILLFSACTPMKKQETEEKEISTEKRKTVNYPVEKVEKTLGEAVTDIIDSGENRVANIKLACSKMSGKVLYPGEEFSFNSMTGKKTEENGYKDAPVIVAGEKSYGCGGGVCQVSTTAYMAALNAGLKVTEHYNHSEKVAYAPEGMDATVVYGVKDLKFVNSTEKDISIYAWVQDDKVYVKLIQND